MSYNMIVHECMSKHSNGFVLQGCLFFFLMVFQSEVSKLEKSLQSAPKGTTAYLVPDAPALCSQLHLIRRLINMEKFLMIIPVQGKMIIGPFPIKIIETVCP